MTGRRSNLKAKRCYGSKEASGGAGLYVYTFPSQRGKKLKIGCSGKDVEKRIRQQISHTSIPEVAEVELIVFIRDAEILERDLHRSLEPRRVVDTSGSREWFRVASVGELLKIAPLLRVACKAAEKGKNSYQIAQAEAVAEAKKTEEIRKIEREETEARIKNVSSLINDLSEIRRLLMIKKDENIEINRIKMLLDKTAMGYMFVIYMLFLLGIPFLFVCLVEYWLFSTSYIAVAAGFFSTLGPVVYSIFRTLSTSAISIQRTERSLLEAISKAGFSSVDDAKKFVQSPTAFQKYSKSIDNERLGLIYDVSAIGRHNLLDRPRSRS